MAVDTNQSWLPDWISGMLGGGGDSAANSMSAGAQVGGYDPKTIAAWYGQKPGAGDSTGMGTGLGMNVGTGQMALSGLGALAGMFNASKQNKLAQEQFKFQKDVTNTNLNNQIKSYNTSLEDRMTARGAMEGRSAGYTADEIARRSLTR